MNKIVDNILVQLFQNILIKISVTGFIRVLHYRLESCVLIRNDPTRSNFLVPLELRLSPQKCLCWIPILAATYNISKDRLVHERCPSGYCEKY